MSYDIYLRNRNGDVVTFDSPHDIRGGTYQAGGCTEAWLNITYNYSKHFYRVIDSEKGIRSIYGKMAVETIPVLEAAIAQLSNDKSSNYWEPTEGNAKEALNGLLSFAKAAPDGIWDGD